MSHGKVWILIQEACKLPRVQPPLQHSWSWLVVLESVRRRQGCSDKTFSCPWIRCLCVTIAWGPLHCNLGLLTFQFIQNKMVMSFSMAMCYWKLKMKVLSEQLVRTLQKIGACICIGLGVIGAFLPVLPTTPFLILATVLSYNSSPKIRRWLLEHPVFGNTIQNYLESRSITSAALRRALVTLWLCLAVSVWLVSSAWVIAMLLATGGLVTLYLLRLKRV